MQREGGNRINKAVVIIIDKYCLNHRTAAHLHLNLGQETNLETNPHYQEMSGLLNTVFWVVHIESVFNFFIIFAIIITNNIAEVLDYH